MPWPRSLTGVIASLALLMVTAIAGRAQPQTSAAAPAPFVARPPPAPPVPSSHRRHTAIGFECRQCHANAGGGAAMGFPPSEICLSCHQAVAADRPTIQKLAALAAAGPIPWTRVYTV